MGGFDTLRRLLTRTASSSTTSATKGIASPWATGELTQVVWRDILGDEKRPATRAEAMSIPALARARHLLVTDAARCPLEVYDGDTKVAVQKPGSWLQRTSLPTSPQHRMVWTVDDLIFYGWSLWIVQRDTDGQIIDGARCPVEWWKFSQSGGVEISGEPVEPSAVLLIPGFHEGVINSHPRTIRAARELETQWAERAANPIPALELHQTTTDTLSSTEQTELVANWKAALADNGGAVAYTPSSIKLESHGDAGNDLLIEGRNAAAIDAARIVGVPAAMIDASNVNSTLTYETLQGRSLEYVDRSLSLYLGPIEARLSLDDVTPAGTLIRANLSAVNALPPPATVGAITKD